MPAIVESILSKVATRLEARLSGDVLLPEKQGGYSPADNQTVLAIQLVRNEALDYPSDGLVMGWTLQVQCQHNILPSEFNAAGDTLPILQLRRAALIQSALTTPDTDGVDWDEWGGLAINSEIGTWEPYSSDDMAGVMVPVEIHYRHPEDDPNTAG
jgi:hypothetical protein